MALKLDTWEIRSDIPGEFKNVVLEKDGDKLDRSCEKSRSITGVRRIGTSFFNKVRKTG